MGVGRAAAPSSELRFERLSGSTPPGSPQVPRRAASAMNGRRVRRRRPLVVDDDQRRGRRLGGGGARAAAGAWYSGSACHTMTTSRAVADPRRRGGRGAAQRRRAALPPPAIDDRAELSASAIATRFAVLDRGAGVLSTGGALAAARRPRCTAVSRSTASPAVRSIVGPAAVSPQRTTARPTRTAARRPRALVKSTVTSSQTAPQPAQVTDSSGMRSRPPELARSAAQATPAPPHGIRGSTSVHTGCPAT